MEADPDTELSQLFPPSIKTLRIAGYIPGVYEPDAWSADDSDGEMDDFNIGVMRDHSDLVYRFLQVLRSCWMLGAEGRELWFRRRIDLDSFAVRSQDPMGRDGLSWILEERMMAENDGFSRVWGLHEYHGNNSDWDEEEMMGVSDLESTEDKHENSDGESDQAQDG